MSVEWEWLVVAVGLFLYFWLLWPRSNEMASDIRQMPTSKPYVSIIVPCRNEAANIAGLLESLINLDYPNKEIIIVDDESEDDTALIAQTFANVRVIQAGTRPLGWLGKQWACHQGFHRARGEILLFSDADTRHEANSLQRVVRQFESNHYSALSALPFHLCVTPWERLLGPFHLLVLALTFPHARPRPGRTFAIGQYMAWTRAAYEEIGGHEAVRYELVEDIPMVHRLLAFGRSYGVMSSLPVFRVRMYSNFYEFIQGWRRILRAGMAVSHPLVILVAMAIIWALVGNLRLWGQPLYGLAVLTAGIFTAYRQRDFGEFSFWGVVLWPLSILLFVILAGFGAFDQLCARPMHWRGRIYWRDFR